MSTFRSVSLAVLSACVVSLVFPSPGEGQEPSARGTVRCESGGALKRCPAAGSWRGARLVHQLSQTACIEGRNWGFDRGAIWVDGGCRGVFEAGDPFANVGERVTCASAGNDVVTCPADVRYGATLVRQLSSASCTEGRSWGTNERGVWVSRGCRGEFLIGSQFGGGSSAPDQRVVCGSPTGQRVTCATGGSVSSARLIRDASGANRCRQNVSWGYNASGVWTENGCVGEFGLSIRGGAYYGGEHSRTLLCGGQAGQEVRCQTEGDALSVRLLSDLSGGRCRQGSTWGFSRTFIWTNGGCRGRFEVALGR